MKKWPAIIAVILILSLGFQIVRPFFNSFAWAAVVVVTSWPLYSRLRNKLIPSPSWSALFMTIGVLVVFLIVVIPLSLQLSKELRGVASVSPAQADQIIIGLRSQLAALPLVGDELAYSLNGFSLSGHEFSELLVRYRQQTLKMAADITRSFFGAIASFFATFFIMFFLFRDGARIGKQLIAAAHRLGGEQVSKLLEIARVTVKAAIFGYLLTALVQGVLAGIGYALAGVPMPLLFAALTAVVSLLPFGTPFAYVPILFYMFFNTEGSFIPVMLLAAWCVGVVSLADNVIRPIVISQAASLSFLLVLGGVLGGILYFGLIGIVLGPVILALIHAMWVGYISSELYGKGIQEQL